MNTLTKTAAINIAGFTVDADNRAWNADASWGLVANEDGTLTLLDSEGYPSNRSLSVSDAEHVIGLRGADDEDPMHRWESYASAR